MRYLYIVNPAANGGKAAKTPEHIRAFYQDAENDPNRSWELPEYEIQLTEAPGHATELAQAAAPNWDVVVAVGGDGTVNEVCRGLIEAKQGTLGVIPAGTGNDMAGGLNLPKNLREALVQLHLGHEHPLDYGLANGNVFMNSASVGFDSLVAHHTNQIKLKVRSHWAYVIGLITALVSFRAPTVQLPKNLPERAGWGGQKRDLCLLAVCNGRFYGGGFEILPDARLDDGQLDICLITNISKLRLLSLLPTIFMHTHLRQRRYVRAWRGRSLTLNMLGSAYLCVDGEIIPLERGESVDFQIVPGAIKLRS
ncbi:hypothetical protein BSR29_00730 [Boudabousia liubingyangii]|uniref:DAGKc domain-containing protein n=1 Tax=Boudabousia liubingyangii TaxID=1921764 RepID=A0A1Q5PPR9_9ACTO|nr:diacylglycerol kinase family protein [Boudabousia liubingyangii]OKL49516.1 hypothetical protein BSR29_00730 [Boudabousia liubingyangii]